MTENLGILHPGEMGISVAVSAQQSGHTAFWASAGRSAATHARAQSHALVDAHSLAELCRTCSIIISVCPPHAAEEVAQQVLAHAFKGLYVDANAIAPQRALGIGAALAARGVAFVDGGIIGGPAGARHDVVVLRPARRSASRVVSRRAHCDRGDRGAVGKASAVKMCYAAYTKGTAALLCAILGAAGPEVRRNWSVNGRATMRALPNRPPNARDG
jgi:3-hydroxyisobutyrate dehydrogenase-like beta-hydroxyacid dehydrogenase